MSEYDRRRDVHALDLYKHALREGRHRSAGTCFTVPFEFSPYFAFRKQNYLAAVISSLCAETHPRGRTTGRQLTAALNTGSTSCDTFGRSMAITLTSLSPVTHKHRLSPQRSARKR
jgi:hypothetical protein